MALRKICLLFLTTLASINIGTTTREASRSIESDFEGVTAVEIVRYSVRCPEALTGYRGGDTVQRRRYSPEEIRLRGEIRNI